LIESINAVHLTPSSLRLALSFPGPLITYAAYHIQGLRSTTRFWIGYWAELRNRLRLPIYLHTVIVMMLKAAVVMKYVMKVAKPPVTHKLNRPWIVRWRRMGCHHRRGFGCRRTWVAVAPSRQWVRADDTFLRGDYKLALDEAGLYNLTLTVAAQSR